MAVQWASRAWNLPAIVIRPFTTYGPYEDPTRLVANTILDLPTGRRFSLSNRREVQDPMWWGGEPIWVRLQNTGRFAATMFWPGSEAPIHGHWPAYWLPLEKAMPGNARVDRVLGPAA